MMIVPATNCRIVRPRDHGFEAAWIEKAVEAVVAFLPEADRRQTLRTVLAARPVAEHQPGVAIGQDEADCVALLSNSHSGIGDAN